MCTTGGTELIGVREETLPFIEIKEDKKQSVEAFIFLGFIMLSTEDIVHIFASSVLNLLAIAVNLILITAIIKRYIFRRFLELYVNYNRRLVCL